MRKLKLQVQITINGFIAGPNGEMDFMTFNWDDELNNYVRALTEPVDCIVLGRKLAEGFIAYWSSIAANAEDLQVEAGKIFTETHKVVFTKTLSESNWHNTVLAKGNLTEEINNLKNQQGGDIIAYGGANLVSALIKEGLVDEYHLMINPVAIGSGLPIFNELNTNLNLTLVKATPFECGIVVLYYVPNISQ